MALESTKILNLFYCYAREDKALRDELDIHLSSLKRQYNIKSWSDREINPGTEWEQEIASQLNTAHIILLLISPHFMASEYCYSIEMKKALERHAAGDARVLPILLRPFDWQGVPFSKLQVLPTDAVPISLWSNRDAACQDVVKGIRLVVEELISSSLEEREKALDTSIVTMKQKQISSQEKVTGELYKLVVIIDDAPTVRKICETALGREGFEVKSFADGVETMRWFMSPEGRIPSLIFIDIGLPRLDGYEVARRLKAKPEFQKTVFVMLSRRDGVVDRLKGRLAGAKGYVTKPFRTQEIISVVHSYIGLPNQG